MLKHIRSQEYGVLLYRLFLAYLFYFLVRALFTVFNYSLLGEIPVSEFFRLSYYGLMFDTAGIFYVNTLFVLLSIFPLYFNTNSKYQKVLFYVYFFFNLVAYATNFIDIIYFKYILMRSTIDSLESVENEGNLLALFGGFIQSYWYLFILFFLLSWLWIYLYKKVNIKKVRPEKLLPYYGISTIFTLVILTLIIGGVRGGSFSRSTRPVNLVDANRHVKNNIHASIVLNTPFSIIRTIGTLSIKKVDYLEKAKAVESLKPIKHYESDTLTKPNIVIIIIESFGKEYLGAFNSDMEIENYKSYTPFMDSLAEHSLIFTNAYANGYKSIHGMSSVLSGIPSFKNAFTSSPYSNQKIESIVSVLENEGYNTSFFHGAENGSMGFLGFSQILGIDNYYGREDFANEDEFDGYWGIWDEPFLQYMKKELDKKQEPFLSTVFTVSSHDPYVIPDKYKDTFPAGDIPMHKCVGYTDYALKRFFEEAKNEPWFDNTIFVMVADHPNQIHYSEYNEPLNLNAVPILFYTASEKFKGVNTELAQQIDIYPTLLNMIGYDKPFRSWGRSLISDEEKPFVMRYMGVYYYFYENYVCLFDGKKVVGFYEIEDKAMEHNLLNEQHEMRTVLEEKCKAFLQVYMNTIVDYGLAPNSEALNI